MNINVLLQGFVSVDLSIDVTGLALDSRKVKDGYIFFAYPGVAIDRRDYIQAAIDQGAAAILVESKGYDQKQSTVPIIPIENLQQHVGEIAARFYDFPSQKLKLIAVTGTNGKSSCAYLLTQAMNLLDVKTALIGTLGAGDIASLNYFVHTTPDPITLQKLFSDFLKAGYQAVVMEASSHALDQGRLNGVSVDYALFTNLTHDHLDYHGSMSEYAKAKQQLFEIPTLIASVFNVDDAIGRQWFDHFKQDRKVYGYSMATQVVDPLISVASACQYGMTESSADIHTPWGDGHFSTLLIGSINIQNLLGVISLLCMNNFAFHDVLNVIPKLSPVPARLERLPLSCEATVILDFAHTPDALEKVLQSMQEVGYQRLILVFGCGGDRDRQKRPLMGGIAERYADIIFVTNDNPRSENPESIANEILAGIKNRGKVSVILDRKEAFKKALATAKKGDIVLVAGRGHETHQIIGPQEIPFKDAAVLAELMGD